MIEFTLESGEVIHINKLNLILVFEEDAQTYLRMIDNLNYPVVDTLSEALTKLA